MDYPNDLFTVRNIMHNVNTTFSDGEIHKGLSSLISGGIINSQNINNRRYFWLRR